MDNVDNASLIYNDTKTPKSLSLVKLRIEALERENGPVGALLSSKALVQLAANPLVGYLTSILGYNVPMVLGSTNLLLAALCKYRKYDYCYIFIRGESSLVISKLVNH